MEAITLGLKVEADGWEVWAEWVRGGEQEREELGAVFLPRVPHR